MFHGSVEINLSEELGYSYIYHYNPYSDLYYCIYRDDYDKYWNGFNNDVKIGWTSGKDMFECQLKMLQRILGVPEDGILGPDVIGAYSKRKK